ncbi:Imm51 family immunity protein [Rhodococcus phenolicus]|uniref:Imm51 family immunity protein n=1 Tax=Rhodococcus phenolicus TaxID=263849 RepID=UPI000835764E|nr:Imm51 family immunity protein [Rhodococcus phenolicus]
MATPGDFDALGPVRLVTHANGPSIIYHPGGPEYHLHRDALDKHGLDGSGYEFSGILRAVLADTAPDTLGSLGFDPEAGTVSVYGNDLDALLAAATTLHALVTDADVLDAAVTAAAERKGR